MSEDTDKVVDGCRAAENVRQELARKRPSESVSISKERMPKLPSEFKETKMGTPLCIAHPGATAQFRAHPALHAYETATEWKIHRDRYDPGENPFGHLFVDAPELTIAALIGVLSGVVTCRVLNGFGRDTREEKRTPRWLAILASLIVALVVAALVYMVCARLRVAHS